MAGINIKDMTTGTPLMTDYLLKSDTDGAYTKITIEDLFDFGLFKTAEFENAGFHNSIYRGKSLGTSYTAEQQSQVSAGTFDDMYVGDYWTIAGMRWRIAGFDYLLKSGDANLTDHHLLMIPEWNMMFGDGSTTHYMNGTDTTEGGYKATAMRATHLPTCLETVESAFGSGHILSHKEFISNTVNGDGLASNGEWVSTKIEIPTESMIFGNNINGKATNGMFNTGNMWGQMPIAKLAPHIIRTRDSFWLRDVTSNGAFASMTTDGSAWSSGASNAWIGVRPFFLLY